MTDAEYLKALEDYLLVKVRAKDWHAVRDATVDIEIHEAKVKARAEVDSYRLVAAGPMDFTAGIAGQAVPGSGGPHGR